MINDKDASEKKIECEYFVNGDKVVIQEIYNLVLNTTKTIVNWNEKPILKLVNGLTIYNNTALYQHLWLQQIGIKL